MNNFDFTSEGYVFNQWMGPASIYSSLEHLTINLVGTNALASSAERGYALYSKGMLTITTDDTNGSLALTGDSTGLQVGNDLIINKCQVTATGNRTAGITSNGTISITDSYVTTSSTCYGMSVVHAEIDTLTPMKIGDLTVTNSVVVATGERCALHYDGGDTDGLSASSGLIPKFVFDNKFVVLAGSDAENAVAAATDAAATYENQHVRIVFVYDVTYKVDGEVVATVEVEHGKDAVAPEIPAKEGYNETAPKWDSDGKNITADTIINAVYTPNNPGEYEDITPETNFGSGKLDDEIEWLKEKIPFTQEEQQQIQHGADVDIWLEVTDISESISTEDKEKVSEKQGNGTVALYLDVTMFKQVGDAQASRLTELSNKVTIRFRLPDSCVNTNQNVTRTYNIIRVHNGEPEIIIPVFDQETNSLSFETDRFSTYAVVYTDTVSTGDNPPTGDGMEVGLWLFVMAASAAALVVLLQKKRMAV